MIAKAYTENPTLLFDEGILKTFSSNGGTLPKTGEPNKCVSYGIDENPFMLVRPCSPFLNEINEEILETRPMDHVWYTDDGAPVIPLPNGKPISPNKPVINLDAEGNQTINYTVAIVAFIIALIAIYLAIKYSGKK